MKKCEVRFSFTNSSLKIVNFDALENARNFCDKVKRVAKANKTHGKLALWINGWLETTECF